MTNHHSANVRCRLVGEYVDEGDVPANLACHPGEVVRPNMVANFLDHGGTGDVADIFHGEIHSDRKIA